MSYILYGQKPAAEEGKLFCLAVFSWPLLVDVVHEFAPEECQGCAEWYGEDCYGQGLDAAQSDRLAAKLESVIEDGRILETICELQEREGPWVSIGDLRDFVSFLKACGGFHIS